MYCSSVVIANLVNADMLSVNSLAIHFMQKHSKVAFVYLAATRPDMGPRKEGEGPD